MRSADEVPEKGAEMALQRLALRKRLSGQLLPASTLTGQLRLLVEQSGTHCVISYRIAMLSVRRLPLPLVQLSIHALSYAAVIMLSYI